MNAGAPTGNRPLERRKIRSILEDLIAYEWTGGWYNINQLNVRELISSSSCTITCATWVVCYCINPFPVDGRQAGQRDVISLNPFIF